MPTRVLVWSVCLVAVVSVPTVPQAVSAQDVSPVQVDAAGFDAVGDSPQAPDIGKVQHSVHVNGLLRRVVIGVWLNRSELAEGERVNLYFDWRGGGEPYFGGDHLFFLDGNSPPYEDTYRTYGWNNGQWVAEAFNNPGVETFDDGRMYFRVDFHPGSSTPENPARVGLRASSTHPGAQIDYAPDAAQSNMAFSLEPHGLADPLEGCTYAGGCVGPAQGPSNFGPETNSGSGPAAGGGTTAACELARRKLRAATRKLSRARRALRSASSRAAYQKQRRTVKRLKRRHAALKRSAAAKC